ncbi:MAG: hypothetical protein RL213_274 [Bacteroidota bacterium]|jgi:hypothetical protein
MSKKSRLSGRQRNRMRMRRLIIAAFAFLFTGTVVTTIIINMTRSDRSRAKDTEIRVMQLMEEEEYVTGFSVDAPVLRPEDRPTGEKIFYKKIH